MLEHLQAGDIDWAYSPCRCPPMVSWSARCSTNLSWWPCRSSTSCASRKSIKPTDLNGETLLLLEDGHCLRDQALDVCARAQLHEKQDFRATSLETLRQMVASGGGITLLPLLASSGAYGNARGVVDRALCEAGCRCATSAPCGARLRRAASRIEAVCEIIAETAGKQVDA